MFEGDDVVPVGQNSAQREKLEETLVNVALVRVWPKAARQNTWRSQAFLEKVGKFLLEPSECA